MPDWLLGVAYFVAVVWLFLGVAIAADIFMVGRGLERVRPAAWRAGRRRCSQAERAMSKAGCAIAGKRPVRQNAWCAVSRSDQTATTH